MHPESESSEMLSVISLTYICSHALYQVHKHVQDEPLVQVFHIVLWFEALHPDHSFCMSLLS